jgi:hypothetical protein
VVKKFMKPSIVPKDSVVQMKGVAPNKRLDIPSNYKEIENT